jgi:hypothetical protein
VKPWHRRCGGGTRTRTVCECVCVCVCVCVSVCVKQRMDEVCDTTQYIFYTLHYTTLHTTHLVQKHYPPEKCVCRLIHDLCVYECVECVWGHNCISSSQNTLTHTHSHTQSHTHSHSITHTHTYLRAQRRRQLLQT